MSAELASPETRPQWRVVVDRAALALAIVRWRMRNEWHGWRHATPSERRRWMAVLVLTLVLALTFAAVVLPTWMRGSHVPDPTRIL
jgi:hypothetical protein